MRSSPRGTGEAPRETRVAVEGCTPDDAERHFLGWADEVDADELFASGAAWGIRLVRRPTSQVSELKSDTGVR